MTRGAEIIISIDDTDLQNTLMHDEESVHLNSIASNERPVLILPDNDSWSSKERDALQKQLCDVFRMFPGQLPRLINRSDFPLESSGHLLHEDRQCPRHYRRKHDRDPSLSRRRHDRSCSRGRHDRSHSKGRHDRSHSEGRHDRSCSRGRRDRSRSRRRRDRSRSRGRRDSSHSRGRRDRSHSHGRLSRSHSKENYSHFRACHHHGKRSVDKKWQSLCSQLESNNGEQVDSIIDFTRYKHGTVPGQRLCSKSKSKKICKKGHKYRSKKTKRSHNHSGHKCRQNHKLSSDSSSSSSSDSGDGLAEKCKRCIGSKKMEGTPKTSQDFEEGDKMEGSDRTERCIDSDRLCNIGGNGNVEDLLTSGETVTSVHQDQDFAEN